MDISQELLDLIFTEPDNALKHITDVRIENGLSEKETFIDLVDEGFLVDDGEYAAIPYGNKGYIIIHKGSQMERLCKTELTARKYIKELKKNVEMTPAKIEKDVESFISKGGISNLSC